MSLTSTKTITGCATVTPEQHLQRVDRIAAEVFADYSRTQLTRWIRSGELNVDGERIRPSARLQEGQCLFLNAVPPTAVEYGPQRVDYQTLHNDEHLLVVNKPAGLVVHPGAGVHTGTLANGLIYDFPQLSGLPRAGLVHRLDQHTSGLMVIAKTLIAHTQLVRLVSERAMERRYIAVVQGRLIAGGVIDAPLGRHPRLRTRQAVIRDGRWARTHYRIRERYRHHTSIECQLETGRTHQIRVHCAHAGFPVVGDPLYAPVSVGRRDHTPQAKAILEQFKRQALCAYSLKLTHPFTSEEMSWQIEPPADMQDLVDVLAADARCADDAS